MTKKNKNIILISIIIGLVIAIIFTVHFAKPCNQKFKYQEGLDTEYVEAVGDEKEPNEDEAPSAMEGSFETTDNSEAAIFDKQKADSENDTQIKKNPRSFHRNRVNVVPIQNGISSPYVFLLCVESFLLGGSVLLLIVNNIDEENNDETKKSKKE